MSSAQPNRCDVEATALDDNGAGTGAIAAVATGAAQPATAPSADPALVVHVGDLRPGERPEVMIDHRSPHKPEAWARLLKRIGPPSPDRGDPGGSEGGRCGGC